MRASGRARGRKNFVPIALLFVVMSTSAKEQTYQLGTVVDVSESTIDEGSLFGPLRICCRLQIRSAGQIYSIVIAGRLDEFRQLNAVQFRVHDKLGFVHRPNGKEWKGKCVAVVSEAAYDSEKSSHQAAPSSLAAPIPFSLSTESRSAVIPMDADILQGKNGCLLLLADLQSDDFFKRFKSRNTKEGKEFRNYSGKVRWFPGLMTVRVILSTVPCAQKKDSDVGAEEIRPELTFDKNFIESLRFEGSWKDRSNLNLEKADLRVLDQARTCSGAPTGGDACWWQYELQIWSKDVPLTRDLVIGISTSDGRPVTRFSANL